MGAGRKKLPESKKRVLVRVWVTKETVDANGGWAAAIKKCVTVLENVIEPKHSRSNSDERRRTTPTNKPRAAKKRV